MLLSLSFHFDYYPLLLVAGVAWLVPILLSLLRLNKIPAVIVEIVLGYFLGHYLLVNHSTESFHILEFLALSGFIFLMFLGGLEIDMDQIRASFPQRRLTIRHFVSNPLLSGVLHFGLAIFLGYLATLVMARLVVIPHTWYFALIMGTTSVGIVLPVLKSRGELSSRFGQMIIIAAALADILSIILFTFTAFIIKNGFRWELLYILVLFFVFFVFYSLGNRMKRLTPLKKTGFSAFACRFSNPRTGNHSDDLDFCGDVAIYQRRSGFARGFSEWFDTFHVVTQRTFGFDDKTRWDGIRLFYSCIFYHGGDAV